eukprot:4176522-Pleurochrysis_carterae.AAC.1
MSRTSEKSAAALASSSALAAAQGQVPLPVSYAAFAEKWLGDFHIEEAHGASVGHRYGGAQWLLDVLGPLATTPFSEQLSTFRPKELRTLKAVTEGYYRVQVGDVGGQLADGVRDPDPGPGGPPNAYNPPFWQHSAYRPAR